MSKQGYTYILASRKHGTLYIGVTSNLVKRIWQHKNNVVEGFTNANNVHILVHYEIFEDITSAIAREKQLKNWNREWKCDLIADKNPEWDDLYENII